MSWTNFAQLLSIKKRTMPIAIQKLLYQTENEINNLVQDEKSMEEITQSLEHFEKYIVDTDGEGHTWDNQTMNDTRADVWQNLIDSEEGINGVLNAQGNYEIGLNYIYEYDYSKNDWRENPIPIGKYLMYLVELDWTQFADIDEVTDDESTMDSITDSEDAMTEVTNSETAMDKVTDKEMPMDKVTDKEMPMDKVTDKEMSRTKILFSSHVINTMWSKTTSSEKFWDVAFSDRDSGEVEYSLVDNGLGGSALEINGTDVDGSTYFAKTTLNFDSITKIYFDYEYDNDYDAPTKIEIDGEEVYSGEEDDSGSKTIELDVTDYTGSLELAIGGQNRDGISDTFQTTWNSIELEE